MSSVAAEEAVRLDGQHAHAAYRQATLSRRPREHESAPAIAIPAALPGRPWPDQPSNRVRRSDVSPDKLIGQKCFIRRRAAAREGSALATVILNRSGAEVKNLLQCLQGTVLLHSPEQGSGGDLCV